MSSEAKILVAAVGTLCVLIAVLIGLAVMKP